MFNQIKQKIEKQLSRGEFNGINFDEALKLSKLEKTADIVDLLNLANKVQLKFKKNHIIKCASVNIPPYKCQEDCKFCALSVHNKAKLTKKDLNILETVDEIVETAKRMEKLGAERFKMVAGGRGLNKKTLEMITEASKRIKKETKLSICASCGLLPSLEIAKELKKAGVDRYNCNFETSRSFFPNICTTHSYDDKIKSIKIAKQAGMDHCGGCLMGLGESVEQRIELAFDIKKYGGSSMPYNMLVPIPGTPMENAKPVPAMELLKFLAIYRLIMPKKDIICNAGRTHNLRDLQALALIGGANGLVYRTYLTAPGRTPEDDMKMIKDLGFY
jgi:biotin synthase